MSKKTTGFDLISIFWEMSTYASLLHKLSSRELCTEYSTQSYFKDEPVHRCEVQEMRRLKHFFNIFNSFFIRTKALVLAKN